MIILKKYDFQPEMYIENELLNVVEVTKLLGVMISSDLKWKENVQYIVSRCMKRLWMLRRIRELGGSSGDLLTVYDEKSTNITFFLQAT